MQFGEVKHFNSVHSQMVKKCKTIEKSSKIMQRKSIERKPAAAEISNF